MKFLRKKIFQNISILSIFILALLIFNGNNRNVKADTDDIYKNIEIFAEVLREIEDNYVEPQETQKLIYGQIGTC